MKTTNTNTNSQNRLAGLATLLLLVASISLGWTQTTNVWTDNFERTDPTDQWNVDNGIWEFGNPATGPATNSAGYRTHDGTNCAATVLAGNYPANTSSRLIRTTPFVVPPASQNPRLQFWHWYQFSGNSYGVVQIKYGTNPWTDLSPRYYNTSSGVWSRPVVDLSGYAGKAVQIAFQIVTDGNVADGWDVDQVSVVKGPYFVGFTNGATESFESGLGDWYAETGTWEVGVPTSGPGATHSGSNCLATVLGGNYEDDRSSRFISPPFVVPSADQLPRLRFWEWFSIGGHDFVQVQIKVGTNAWQALSSSITLDSFGRWTRAFLDLTQYAGQTVELGFYFESHGYTNPNYPYQWLWDTGLGWYVDEVTIETGPLPTIAFPEGFENGWGGWQVDYIGGRVTDFGIWEIGQPTSGPGAAHTGTNCAATVLNGNYPDDRSARLVSPSFVVPTADENPRLRFWSWYSIAGHDFCELQIKVGTNAWQAVHHYTSTGSGVWNQQGFDFSAYAGQTVQVGFYFESHGYQNPSYPYQWLQDTGLGWYVDDVALVTGTIKTLQPNIAEGFESGWNDWYAEDGTWEIGKPTSGPGAAHAGTNCAATVLGGNYADDTSGRLVSPPFVVPAVGTHPNLRFWHWFSIAGHDFCEVQIKVAGGSWQVLSHYSPANSGAWTRPSFDLSQYAGQTVQLSFYFESHGYQNPSYPYQWLQDTGPGWYVDEVMITDVTPPTGIVQFTDVRYFVNEGETNVTISFERKYGSSGALDVTFVATDGSAVGGVDFDSVVDTISWADGEQGVKTDIVPIHQNCSVRGNKYVTLQLLVPGSVSSSVALENATLVIIDSCLPPLTTTTNIAYLRSLVGTTNYVPTDTNTLFTVDGTVTTYANLSSAASDELFYMQDNTNGIAVYFRNGVNQFMPQAGDRVRVSAALTNINGLLALAPDYNNVTNVVWRLSSGNALPAPAALDFTTRTNVPVMEAMESRYVIATNVWISRSSGTNFPTVQTDLLVTNQAGQTFNLTINPNTDIDGQPIPTGAVTILGVLNQNDSTAPYTTNYALLPTRYADIISGAVAPTIIGQPQGRTNVAGTTATFSVSAIGNQPFAYQWRRFGTNLLDGGIISGSKTNVLTLLNVQLGDAATNYLVVVTNVAGSVTSTLATLTVVIPPGISSLSVQPSSPVAEGTNATFCVTATGTLPLTYQWRWNGASIAGATQPCYTVTNVQLGQAGAYSVAVTNPVGGLISGDLPMAVIPGWNTNTVGSTGSGSYSINGSIFTVNGSGEDIEGTADDFFFVHKTQVGDGQIVARMLGLVPADPHSEAGVMFRDGTNSGARHVFVALDSTRHVLLRRRLVENDYSVQNAGQGTNWLWLRLMRQGNTFTGHASTNGVDWSLIWWTTLVNMPTNLEVGLAVTAHKNFAIATAQFDNVTPGNLTPLTGTWPLPGPWICMGGESGGMAEFQRVGGLKFLVGGVVGDQFSIKCSANATAPLSSWVPLGTITNQYGVVPFVDPQALTNRMRFYRAQRTGP